MKKHFNIALVFLIISCSHEKNNNFKNYFKNTSIINIKSERVPIEKDTLFIGYSWKINYADSLIIVNDVNNFYRMKIIDLRTKKMRNFGKIGKGPNEYFSSAPFNNISITQSKKIYINDQTRYYSYNLDDLINNIDTPISKIVIDPKNNGFTGSYTSFCNGDYIIGAAFHKRFALYNINTKVGKTDYEYERGSHLSNGTMFYNHPTENKVAFIMNSHESIGTLTIKNDSIDMKELTWWKHSDKEVSEKTGNSVSTSVNWSIDSRECFRDAVTSNEFIYVLYSGKNSYIKKTGKLRTDRNDSKWVYVFDWEGNPIKVYKLDQEVRCITLDRKNNVLYSLSLNNGNPYLIKFKLN